MNYVTLFDSQYLLRGVAMIKSLRKFDSESSIHVLSLDDECKAKLSEHFERDNGVLVYGLEDLDASLMSQIRDSREHREFCWTLGSVFSDWIMNREQQDLVYLDADIYFFGDPAEILREVQHADLAAIPHRFPQRLQEYEINGRFNVQWVYFRSSAVGRAALSRWSAQCIDCCDYAPDRGVVGDQKYLDEWPNLYPTFREIRHLGAGVAPWNHERSEIVQKNGEFLYDDHHLIFYHFHNFRIEPNGHVQLSAPMYEEVKPLSVNLYQAYLTHLTDVSNSLEYRGTWPDPSKWSIRKNRLSLRRLLKSKPLRHARTLAKTSRFH